MKMGPRRRFGVRSSVSLCGVKSIGGGFGTNKERGVL